MLSLLIVRRRATIALIAPVGVTRQLFSDLGNGWIHIPRCLVSEQRNRLRGSKTTCLFDIVEEGILC